MELNNSKATATSEKLVIEEIDAELLSDEHIKRVQYMVKEYKGSIKIQLDKEGQPPHS